MRVSWPLALGLLLVGTAAARLAFLRLLGDFMNGDEAVGGLMALKIADGEQFPLIFWEAHYSGAFPFYVAAATFRLFEPSLLMLRLAVLPLALAGTAAIVCAARALWGPGPALIGGLWLVLGPPLLFTYTAQAIPADPDVFAFGGLTIWLGVRLAGRRAIDAKAWALLGAVAGFGVYGSPFVLPIFAGVMWALHAARGRLTKRDLVPVAAGFVAGLSPLIVHNIMFPAASVLRLGSRVLNVSREEMAGASSLLALLTVKTEGYVHRLLGYPWTLVGNVPSFLALPVWGTLVAAAVVLAAVLSPREHRRDPAAGAAPPASPDLGWALLGRCGLVVLIFSWVSGLDAVRHLFPFFLLVPMGLAALWARAPGRVRVVAAIGLAIILVNNAVTTARDLNAGEPAVSTLAEALAARGVRFVYTDYSIAYPLLFLSRERIIASPAAGPTNVDRYPPYTRAVAAAPRPAYVFLRDSDASAAFVREMCRAGLPFSREAIAEFDVYLPDRRVDPRDLALPRKF